jgi:hypothetical protein
MIKKWNIFLESYSDKELSEIKDKVGEFMGEKEINDLIKSSILKDIMEFLLKYTEWRYDKISKEIYTWYKKEFDEEPGWVGSNWESKLLRKSYGDKAVIISNAIDFYTQIKDEFETDGQMPGYPKISQISKDVELISVSTLDQIEFYEVYENSFYIIVRLGSDNQLNVESLEILNDELVPLCARIKDQLNLKNEFIKFDEDEAFGITLGFVNI